MEEEEKRIQKRVSDLGACAYLLMHAFKVSGYDKQERAFIFDILSKNETEFEEKQDEYLNSEFHRFDSCLMSLKKRYKTY